MRAGSRLQAQTFKDSDAFACVVLGIEVFSFLPFRDMETKHYFFLK